jgi:hypothetical protein
MQSAVLVAALVSLLVPAGAIHPQQASVFPRVQALVNSGNRTAARTLADSALAAAPGGSDAFADALFARAFATADAAAAERDYVRLTIEFPRSPRLEEALFLSGQFRMARQDNAGARRQFERIVLEFPMGPNAARAAFWAGRMALADGDLASGCASLSLASEREQSDIELRNQIEYVRARCRTGVVVAPDSTPTDSVATSRTPTTAGRVSEGEYSVQVAAFARRNDAVALSNRLLRRGFQVRVVGTRSPYRVRVGRYPTRELAVAAMGRMKRSNVTGIVVEAEPK